MFLLFNKLTTCNGESFLQEKKINIVSALFKNVWPEITSGYKMWKNGLSCCNVAQQMIFISLFSGYLYFLGEKYQSCHFSVFQFENFCTKSNKIKSIYTYKFIVCSYS